MRHPRERRLRKPAQFAAAGKSRAALRGAGTWFALAAVARPPVPAAPVRFGWIVPKRYARRAVDRNLIKRILSESARHATRTLDAVAGAPLDVIVRLRATVPPVATTARAALRRDWRAEADALFAGLQRKLQAGAAP